MFLTPAGAPLKPTVYAEEKDTIARYDVELNLNREMPSGIKTTDSATHAEIMYVFWLSRESPDEPPESRTIEPIKPMYLSQPPITTAMLCVHNNGDEELGRCSLRDPDGLKFGFIKDSANQMIRTVDGVEDMPIIAYALHFQMPKNARMKEQWDAELEKRDREREREHKKSEVTLGDIEEHRLDAPSRPSGGET